METMSYSPTEFVAVAFVGVDETAGATEFVEVAADSAFVRMAIPS